MLIGLFTPSLSTSSSGFRRRNSSKNFILLNDDNHPRYTIYNEIHWELLSPPVCVFFESKGASKKIATNNHRRRITKEKEKEKKI
jgi:hypothetical protein